MFTNDMSIHKKIIFHYPGPFYDVLDGGERKRPKRMYEAFCELGYDVYSIIGSYAERKEKFDRIKDCINEFDFVYSENTTLPLRCSAGKHFPVFNNIDYKLFKILKKNKIPHGVFCRDIYWCYKDFIKEVGILKYFLSIPFYLEEMYLYLKYADKVFVPSDRFSEVIPIIPEGKCIPLPPAGDDILIQSSRKCFTANEKIKLIYVGSVAPPFYDITELLKRIETHKDSLQLTIVTRENLWKKFSDYYGELSGNIEILHVSGDELEVKLNESHISVIYLQETKYRKLAMPLKLFEAVGTSLPIISFGDCSVSDFVEKNDIGWSVLDDKIDIFKFLIEHPEEIEKKRRNVLSIQDKHTWKARVEQVVESLTTN